MEEILAAQGQVSAATREELGLRMHEGIWVAPNGDAVFIPDEPPHLRIRLMLVGHAGAAGHRGIRATQEAVTTKFWWPCARGEVEAWDQVTGGPLDPHLVIEARALGMEHFTNMNVYTRVHNFDFQRNGGTLVCCRWVGANTRRPRTPELSLAARWVGVPYLAGNAL